MWERRYGFPKPRRDDNGERQYSVAEVTKLRAIKRLMDVGTRPGKIIGLSAEELNALADARVAPRRETLAPVLERDVLALLQQSRRTGAAARVRESADAPGAAEVRARHASRRSIARSATRGCAATCRSSRSTCTPSSCRSRCARRSTRFRASPAQPRALLTTLPNEQHGLGLLMVEALLVPEGVQCISLGPQTPIEDIRRAALAHRVHIVALSFSAAFPVRQAGRSARRAAPPVAAATSRCGPAAR